MPVERECFCGVVAKKETIFIKYARTWNITRRAFIFTIYVVIRFNFSSLKTFLLMLVPCILVRVGWESGFYSNTKREKLVEREVKKWPIWLRKKENSLYTHIDFFRFSFTHFPCAHACAESKLLPFLIIEKKCFVVEHGHDWL